MNTERSIWTRFIHLLVRLIAGKRTIVLNASLRLIEQEEEEGVLLEGLRGALVYGCEFGFPHDNLVLRIGAPSAGAPRE